MGDLVQVSSSDWCAWTGGRPNASWTTLMPSAKTSPSNAFQYRPSSPGAAQKSTFYREQGLEPKFTRTSNLLEFIDTVQTYLERTGMDTIAYRATPDDPSNMQFVVTEYSKFKLADVVESSKTLRTTKYDLYDLNNDVSATNWLLNSIDSDLKQDLTDRLHLADGFAPHWIQLLGLIQSVSFARFDRIKRDIESISILKYPQQNIKLMATDFLLKAKELCSHGHYEHRLTLTMLNKFLEGGGTGGDHYTLQFRHALLDLRSKLDRTLVEIGQLSTVDQDKRMAKDNLTYRDICQRAEEEWKKLYDDGRWGPAKIKPDTRKPAASFGANLLETFSGDVTTQALVAALGLIQSAQKANGPKPGKCRNCGEDGHWAKECPNKNKTGDSKKDEGSGNSWRKKKPNASWCKKVEEKDGEVHWLYKHKGKEFHYCNICNRWTVSHWTKTHKKRSDRGAETPDQRDTNASYLAAVTGGTPFDIAGAFHLNVAPDCHSSSSWSWLDHALPFCHLLVYLFGTMLIVGFSGMAPALWFSLGYIGCCIPTLFFTDSCQWHRRDRRHKLKHWTRTNRKRHHRFGSHQSCSDWRQPRNRSCWKPRKPRHGTTERILSQSAEDVMFQEVPWKMRQKGRQPKRRPSCEPRGRRRRRHTDCMTCTRTPHAKHHFKKGWPGQPCSVFSLESAADRLAKYSKPFSILSGFKRAKTFPVIWDSGASVCLTFDKADFVGPLDPPPTHQRTTACVGTHIKVKGMGHVAWSIADTTGVLRTLKLPALYAPSSKVRLLSTSSLLSSYPHETIQLNPTQLVLSGCSSSSPPTSSIIVMINPTNNLAVSEAQHPNDYTSVPPGLHSVVREVSDANLNLSNAEREWL